MKAIKAVALALPLATCCQMPESPVGPVAVVGYEMASAEAQPVLCTDSVTKEKVRAILLEALDDALKQQVMHTFEVWMKDDRDQPARARTGVMNAIRAYIGARKGAMQFEIMECPG